MLLPTFFFADIQAAGSHFTAPLPTNAYMVYRVGSAGYHALEPFYAALFTSRHQAPFCISIILDKALCNGGDVEEKITDYCLSISFHYQYLRNAPGTFHLFVENARPEYGDFADRFRHRFIAQGYENVEMECIQPQEGVTWVCAAKQYIIFRQPNLLPGMLSAYFDALKNIDSFDSAMLIFICSAEELLNSVTALQQAVDKLQQQLPQLYQLLNEGLAMQKKMRDQDFAMGRLRENSASQRSYQAGEQAADGLYHKKVQEIAEFFRQEYEILPLWYKRFGHVLKVIMGKRTLKSLFNDNVKKYNG